jgi:hypothetical protein
MMNIVEQDDCILSPLQISLGGGLSDDLARLLVLVAETFPEWFREELKITSVFDCFPGLIWGGGRPLFGSVSLDEAVDRVGFFNQRGIGVYFTFTNSLLTAEHLEDEPGNKVLQMFENPLNGIVVNSELLEKHIRRTCPLYKIIFSITKVEYDKNKLLDATSNYDLVVIPPEYNHDREFLRTLPSEKIELSFMESCQPFCPDRLNHYVYSSKVILGLIPFERRYFAKRRCRLTGEMELDLPEMFSLAKELGIRKFKCASRDLKEFNKMLAYFVKMPYQEAWLQFVQRYFQDYQSRKVGVLTDWRKAKLNVQ